MDYGLDNVKLAPPLRRRGRRLFFKVAKLNQDFYSTSDDYESKEDDVCTMALSKDDPRHIYRDEIWNQTYFTYYLAGV